MQIIIFDTEFTAWEGSAQRNWSLDWEHREIIQIAAVKVALDSNCVQVISSFNTLVKPVVNPKLSDYIVQLTGIEQQVLDDMGIDFQDALSQLHAFCSQGTLPCYSWGNDKRVLLDNCLLSGVAMLDFNGGFHNLHRIARNAKLDGAHLCSGELASHLGLELNGHIHNALYDVRSIALALQQWVEKGALPASLLQSNLQSKSAIH
ncbi:3'-5' exonuclease [Paraglaciecola arctica]|uniref:3'-5' exonuclease n=1 Tax=Paraglaciecola arctica TaxID=1128911 RepID=UPI001C070CAB|nr:3'-5' exonuclease [Paraglaciecola arctica]MBU3005874.1 exonuclease domain-containing protein [Paraglaciecola arctica]